MKKLFFSRLLLVFPLLLFLGCAPARMGPFRMADTPLVPIQKASLQATLQEQEGLEILWQDAKDVRDFYRGGVQQKAKGEKKYEKKAYAEAADFFETSNEYLQMVLRYINQDMAEYPLFEGTNFIFMPNLLIADNYLKMGRIMEAQGNQGAARRKWKQAIPFLEQSLRCERTEWGLAVRQELGSLLGA